MQALNSDVLVVVAGLRTLAGQAPKCGTRVQLVDVRTNSERVRIFWYRTGRGKVFTCTAGQALGHVLPLSGPRRA